MMYVSEVSECHTNEIKPHDTMKRFSFVLRTEASPQEHGSPHKHISTYFPDALAFEGTAGSVHLWRRCLGELDLSTLAQDLGRTGMQLHDPTWVSE
jgi:hypothetical protein